MSIRQTDPPRSLDRASEIVVLALAVGAPWAFGSVEAWAQLLLAGGIAALAALRLASDLATTTRPGRRRFDLAGAALGSLALLALIQATALPDPLSRWLSPALQTFRDELAPRSPVGVAGEALADVPPPLPTLALEPGAAVQAAGLLAAAWVLYRSARALATPDRLRRFGIATAANAGVMALFAMAQSLSWEGQIYGWRESPIRYGWHTGGPFVGHNPLAAYLNLGLGFAAGLMLHGSVRQAGTGPRYGPAWAGLAAGLCATGLLASHSRAGFLAAAVGGLVLQASGGRVGRRGLTCLLGLAAVAAALLLALGTASPFRRLATIPGAGASGMNGRAAIWEASLVAAHAYGPWGAGLGNFAVALPRFLDEARDAIYFHAENEYLQMAVEGGLPGLSLLLLAMASIGRSARIAWRDARARGEGAVIAGAIFGLVALGVQSLGDFAPHIPGVSCTALVAAAYLAGLARRPPPTDVPEACKAGRRLWRDPDTLASVAGLAAICCVLYVAQRDARVEAAMAATSLPLPGSDAVVEPGHQLSRDELSGLIAGLEQATRRRPDWALGHLRLGVAYLQRYEDEAADWLGNAVDGEQEPDLLTDPLWLHGSVHSASAEELKELGLLQHDPIRDSLVPAARSFLLARRYSPFLAAAHAHLGVVDYLLTGEEGTRPHVGRVLRLAGPDLRLLDRAAIVALQTGDLDLAARCWRRVLELEPSGWADVADLAAVTLEPAAILDEVLPPRGHLEVEFADHLFAEPDDEPSRRAFLLAAVDRAAADPTLAPAARTWTQARALARLGESARARPLMERAVEFAPDRPDWRLELVEWLTAWGDAEAARRQALVGTQLQPEHTGLRRALKRATEAVARDSAGSSPETRRP